jgi:hypothetical protein
MSDPTLDAIRTLAVDVAHVRLRWASTAEAVYGDTSARRLRARAALQQVRSALATAQAAVAEANSTLDALARGDVVGVSSEPPNVQAESLFPDLLSGGPCRQTDEQDSTERGER